MVILWCVWSCSRGAGLLERPLLVSGHRLVPLTGLPQRTVETIPEKNFRLPSWCPFPYLYPGLGVCLI